MPIQIKVFPDSVYIFSVGKLPDNWTVETLFEKHGSIPRNPYVAATIFRTGMVETWGRGIEKIVEGCELIDAPNPIYKNNGSDMSLEFIAPEDAILHQGSIDKKPIDVDRMSIGREAAVIAFIQKHGGIANRDAQALLGIANTTANQLFRKMVSEGTLKALGERRHRVYVLTSTPA